PDLGGAAGPFDLKRAAQQHEAALFTIGTGAPGRARGDMMDCEMDRAPAQRARRQVDCRARPAGAYPPRGVQERWLHRSASPAAQNARSNGQKSSRLARPKRFAEMTPRYIRMTDSADAEHLRRGEACARVAGDRLRGAQRH